VPWTSTENAVGAKRLRGAGGPAPPLACAGDSQLHATRASQQASKNRTVDEEALGVP
jgi:hypothetical protein